MIFIHNIEQANNFFIEVYLCKIGKLWDNKATRWIVSHIYNTMASVLCVYISIHIEVIS